MFLRPTHNNFRRQAFSVTLFNAKSSAPTVVFSVSLYILRHTALQFSPELRVGAAGAAYPKAQG